MCFDWNAFNICRLFYFIRVCCILISAELKRSVYIQSLSMQTLCTNHNGYCTIVLLAIQGSSSGAHMTSQSRVQLDIPLSISRQYTYQLAMYFFKVRTGYS